ncbi:MAG: trehalose-6-phosphate synthase [Actinomycetota bacterium]
MQGRHRLIIASNRGPFSFSASLDGRIETKRGVGGLVTAVMGGLHGVESAWLSVAMSEDDRVMAASGQEVTHPEMPGVTNILLPTSADGFRLYYGEASNRLLWFAMHGLPLPDLADEAWDAYRAVNERMAGLIAARAAQDARVLVQDYHLALVPRLLASSRPDLRIGVTWHIPFPTSQRWSATPIAGEVMEGLAAARFVNFHSSRWADRYRAAGGTNAQVRALGVDPVDLAQARRDPTVAAHADEIREWAGDRCLIVRADRIDPAKGITLGIRGFAAALTELGTTEVRHLMRLTPSRMDIPEYAHELAAIEALVADLSPPDQEAVVRSEVTDDRARTFGALMEADVILITSLADGMNLVAREGPLLNRRDAALVLSKNTGAHDELGEAALVIDPAELEQIAAAITQACRMDDQERRRRAARLRSLAPGTSPDVWLREQFEELAGEPA